jgi:endonuclease YncB( thermonuclease family)
VKRDSLKLLQTLLRNVLSQAKRRKSSGPLLIVILTIAVFGISQLLEEPSAPLPGRGIELSCKISAVHDGDTVDASCDTGRLKVRVFGIDAPEIGQKPWGDNARTYLKALVPDGKVRVQVIDTDRYGRSVARLYNGEQDLGLTMVRQGWAVMYSQYNTSSTYETAQAQAKRERLGVWSRPGAQQEPWEWRKLNPR